MSEEVTRLTDAQLTKICTEPTGSPGDYGEFDSPGDRKMAMEIKHELDATRNDLVDAEKRAASWAGTVMRLQEELIEARAKLQAGIPDDGPPPPEAAEMPDDVPAFAGMGAIIAAAAGDVEALEDLKGFLERLATMKVEDANCCEALDYVKLLAKRHYREQYDRATIIDRARLMAVEEACIAAAKDELMPLVGHDSLMARARELHAALATED